MTDQPTHVQSLADSVKAAQIPPSDDAALALAHRYAEILDRYPEDAEVHERIGPRYLATLTALGLTKAGRAVSDKVVSPDASPGRAKRDELRERRARRTAG